MDAVTTHGPMHGLDRSLVAQLGLCVRWLRQDTDRQEPDGKTGFSGIKFRWLLPAPGSADWNDAD